MPVGKSALWVRTIFKKEEKENRDQVQALFSPQTRLSKHKLRPEVHFSDNLDPSGYSKIQNISKFGLDMPIAKSGLKVRTNQQNVTNSCAGPRGKSLSEHPWFGPRMWKRHRLLLGLPGSGHGRRSRRVVMSAGLSVLCLAGSGYDVMVWPGTLEW